MNMDREAYITEVSRVIRQNFRPDDVSGSMTAAKAGWLVRQVFQSGPLGHGFHNFKEVLQEVERHGQIKIGPNSKQALAIWLPGVSTGAEPTKEQVTNLPADNRFRSLRKWAWLAFVAETPIGRRFMNKRTGKVLLGQENCPEPEDEWIEIEKIPDAEDKADAREFVIAEGLQQDTELQNCLNSEYWYSKFPDRLKDLRADLVAKWNRRRSIRVFARAEAWRERYGILPEMVYPSIRSCREGSPRVDAAVRAELRDALLTAVQAMETAELLELRIPAHRLVRILRPDLNPHE